MNNHARWHIPITIVFLFLGIMLSIQFQAQKHFASNLSLQKPESLIAMIRALSDKRQKLALEIIDLGSQLGSQLENDQDERKFNQEMEKLRTVNGTVPLKGSGIIITIEEHMPIVYTDILDIINELWNAGAEAISINDHRISGNYTISDANDDSNKEYGKLCFIVNHEKLDFPVTIKAIGDPNNLEKGLTLPGGIMDRLDFYYNIYPPLEKVAELGIPAIQKPNVYYFLREYKAEEKAS